MDYFFFHDVHFFLIQSTTPIQSHVCSITDIALHNCCEWLTHDISETCYSVHISFHRLDYHISIKITFAKLCQVESDYIELKWQQIRETTMLKQIMILPSVDIILHTALYRPFFFFFFFFALGFYTIVFEHVRQVPITLIYKVM